MVVITLPWPPKQLSPNTTAHWAVKNLHKQRYKQACYWLAMEAGIRPNQKYKGPFAVHMKFIPPTRRNRDEDNLIASMKAALDGIADAMGVNDTEFRLTHEVDRANIAGMVEVSIEGMT